MKHYKPTLLAFSLLLSSMGTVLADGHAKVVGGAPMLPELNIVENAVNSADHTTLVAAVKAAGLVETLSSKGPFTVFAPVNEGFAELPAGTVENLLKPENKATLQKVLTAHVVAGKLDAEALMQSIQSGNGYTNLKTVSGDTITLRMDERGIYIFDESGGVSRVTISDVLQSNGVIHVIDDVPLPK